MFSFSLNCVQQLDTMQVSHVGKKLCNIYLNFETINLGGCF